jgi:glycosyltransferase involved in cell wall biosynthesis
MHSIGMNGDLSHALRDIVPASLRGDEAVGRSGASVTTQAEAVPDLRTPGVPTHSQRCETDRGLVASNVALAEAMTRFQTCGVVTHGETPPPRPLATTSGGPVTSRSVLGAPATRPSLRIAQLAPPAERVPPELYGGTERVVSALTEELVRRGHQVTLFASGDSHTAAKLVPVCPRALRLDTLVSDVQVYTMRELGLVFSHADAFDIIHNHLDYFALPFTRLTRTPVVTTLHGRLDLPDLPMIFGDYPDAPLVSVSYSQRTPLFWANWAATVYNGIDLRAYPTVYQAPGAYFAFIGRISPEKNIEAAIRIARATAIPLKIAAKVDRADRDYYERIVRPLIDGRFIEYVGEINEESKNAFLGGAYALLFPVDWPEPFGLAMTEAMACGTPVLALRRGSVPEVVADGVTGFVRDTEAELITVARQIPSLDRRRCRQRVETYFSATAMADGYEAVYRSQLHLRDALPTVRDSAALRHPFGKPIRAFPESTPVTTTALDCADDQDR